MNLSRHARPMRRTTYDTHVRASLRGCGSPDVEFPTITHYELRIMNLSRHARPMTRTSVRLYVRTDSPDVDFPHNYALCIMNYEFIQTRTTYDTHVRIYETHDRASLREDRFTRCGIPNNYALCIMNYELSRHARPMTRTSVRLYERVYYQMRGIPNNYAL